MTVDATGLEARHVSRHYQVRRGDAAARHAYRAHERRVWPKLTAVAETGSHLIVGAVTAVRIAASRGMYRGAS